MRNRQNGGERGRHWRRTLMRPPTPRARAALALALSYVCPGWGHVYAGHPLRGLFALALVVLVVAPAWVIAGTRIDGAAAGTVAMAGAWLLWVALPLDAALRALGRRPPNSLTAVAVVAVFLVAGQAVLSAEYELFRTNVKLFHTPTPSMVPTLLPGDVILADVRPWQPVPEPGEIVVFRRPGESELFAKRAVAFGGSTVSLRGGRLEVDGRERTLADADAGPGRHVEALGDQRYTVEVDRGGAPPDFGPVRVPEGHVFVLGDSRARSVDSREFGPVPLDAIEGRALRVIWSRDPSRPAMRWERTGQVVGALITDS